MAWVNFSVLLGGVLLMGLPIVLHLMMRQRPKPLVFPALRFVKQREAANKRRLRLRHWLLLLLRCLAILAAAAALARPSVDAGLWGHWLVLGGLGLVLAAAGFLTVLAWALRRGWLAPALLGAITAALLAAWLSLAAYTIASGGRVRLGDEEAPLAAALLVDTSPRMLYRHGNRERLGEAVDVAGWVASQLPKGSDIILLDASRREPIECVDLAAAKQTLGALRVTPRPAPLTERLARAARALQGSRRQRKEIYVFTDLTRPAWEAPGVDLPELLAQDRPLLYVVDIGVESPRNVALGDIELSAQVLPENAELTVRVPARAIGGAAPREVELLIEEPDPRFPVIVDGVTQTAPAARRGWQRAELADPSGETLEFRLRLAKRGVHHGRARVIGEDNLALDDIRYFTVESRPAWSVLVAAPEDVITSFLVQALAPDNFPGARFRCDTIRLTDLPNQNLGNYDAVCLLDPPPLTPAAWEQLYTHVEAGGGLAIFAGHNLRPDNANSPAAQKVLPGLVRRDARSGGYLFPRGHAHPVLAPFRPMASSVPWRAFPVYRHWVVEKHDDAEVVLTYRNGDAALLEKSVGAASGRVLLLTTPVSDPSLSRYERTWNELPTGENPWPYFILVNEMFARLTAGGGTRLNHVPGERAELPNDPRRHPRRYTLFLPEGGTQDVAAVDDRLTIGFTESIGAYRLKGQREGDPSAGGPTPSGQPAVGERAGGDLQTRGFSVNLPAAASDLTRVSRAELDQRLGADRYQLARGREEITREQGEARRGLEFYPYLATLLVIVLACEHVMANLFYARRE